METARCPLCESSRIDLIQPHPDFSGSAVHRCPACAFWFAAPVPTEAELIDYYRTTYARRRTWAASPDYLALMQRRAVAQREFMGPEIGSIRTAVDIGCGVGALVVELTQAGVDAVGYDSDDSVIQLGRSHWQANIAVRHETGAKDDGRRFDLLCLSHVVEHLREPVKDLKKLLAQIEPGGWLFVEVPQVIPWMFEQRLDTESHLGFHTRQSLEILAATVGLDVVRLRNCGPPIIEHYTRGAAPSSGPTRWVGVFRTIGSRLARRLTRMRGGSASTEYDGYFDHYFPKGQEQGMWLRALLHKPSV